jgi:hypothetical protein
MRQACRHEIATFPEIETLESWRRPDRQTRYGQSACAVHYMTVQDGVAAIIEYFRLFKDSFDAAQNFVTAFGKSTDTLSKNYVRRLNRLAILSRSIESTKIAAARLSKSRFQPADQQVNGGEMSCGRPPHRASRHRIENARLKGTLRGRVPTALRPSRPVQQWVFHQAEKGIDISAGRAIWRGHRKGRLKFLFML